METEPGWESLGGDELDYGALRERFQKAPGMYFLDTTARGITEIAFSMIVDAVHFRGARFARLAIHTDHTLDLEDDGEPLSCGSDHWRLAWRRSDHSSGAPPLGVVKPLGFLAATSDVLQARTREGVIAFRRGRRAYSSMLDLEKGETRLRLRPCPRVFGPHPSPDLHALCGLARNYAATSPGTTIQIVGVDGHERTFAYPRGLVDLAAEMRLGLSLHPQEHFDCRIGDRELSVVVGPWVSGAIHFVSFVNHWRTWGHGSHVRGVQLALEEIHGGSVDRMGLLVLVSVILPEPNWLHEWFDKIRDLELAEMIRRECVRRLRRE